MYWSRIYNQIHLPNNKLETYLRCKIHTLKFHSMNRHIILYHNLAQSNSYFIHINFKWNKSKNLSNKKSDIYFYNLQGAKGNTNIPVFQCHGEADPMVSIRWGQATHDIVKKFCPAATFKTYSNLGHSSSPQVSHHMVTMAGTLCW